MSVSELDLSQTDTDALSKRAFFSKIMDRDKEFIACATRLCALTNTSGDTASVTSLIGSFRKYGQGLTTAETAIDALSYVREKTTHESVELYASQCISELIPVLEITNPFAAFRAAFDNVLALPEEIDLQKTAQKQTASLYRTAARYEPSEATWIARYILKKNLGADKKKELATHLLDVSEKRTDKEPLLTLHVAKDIADIQALSYSETTGRACRLWEASLTALQEKDPFHAYCEVATIAEGSKKNELFPLATRLLKTAEEKIMRPTPAASPTVEPRVPIMV